MIAYIQGKIAELTPTYVVIDNNQVGYHIHISLNTYEKIQKEKEVKLFIYHFLKDTRASSFLPVLYGFAEVEEKELFIHLIGVSGIGTVAASTMLSTYSPSEIKRAIVNGDAKFIQTTKGIGPKASQKVIIELRDKFAKEETTVTSVAIPHNTNVNEALKALQSLGFAESTASKAIKKAIQQEPDIATVENLIKKSLKNL